MIKTISFKNAKGETITGVLKEKKTSGPLLIVNHGFKSSKDHPATSAITDDLYTMGHSTFSFDFSTSANGFHLQEQVSDIRSIIKYFKEYKEFIILAPSLGAVNAVVSVVQLPKIRGIITINGFFGSVQLGRSIIKEYLLFRLLVFFNKQYKQNWNYFKQQYKPENITCNILVIHAKHDEVVFISQSKKFFQKTSGKREFYMLQNADHHLTSSDSKKEVVMIIDQWLRRAF